MTTEPPHPYNDITGRREIREDLRSALGYPIRPNIYSIQFIQNGYACYLEVVEADEGELLPLNEEKIPTWKTTLVPLTQFGSEDGTLLFPPEILFEENLDHFLTMISPFDFTPLGIDLFTDEVEELIREEYCRDQGPNNSPRKPSSSSD